MAVGLIRLLSPGEGHESGLRWWRTPPPWPAVVRRGALRMARAVRLSRCGLGRQRLMQHASQASDPFFDLLRCRIREVQAKGVAPRAVGEERRAGNKSDVLGDSRMQDLGSV